ncbi:phosphatidylglycerol specific phospholipase [Aspergillus heteromorphus CBS 117.55]|uniref:Phosphatidylglycerol specific phospholipase n=1 Tax=Aspergillus heteromorphus CBS 117.55 TaxID=1448321 RepID=A0A317V1T5_9EURO|nr:phosphatidylglycerol specific phospholipase [Aspergillus heteromorphus CBS 117.55]PWY66712.1 phosphatidylglycerol specific phospholipase [Aspergillus heteromorphus CBS 117.55]
MSTPSQDARRETLRGEEHRPLLGPDGEVLSSDSDSDPHPRRWAASSWVRTGTITLGLLLASALLVLVFFSVGLAIPGLPHPPGKKPPAPRGPIKNVVVLVQENLSFDAFAGGLTYSPHIDGLVNRSFCNPANINHPHPPHPQVCAKPTAKNVAPDDPDHSIAGGSMQIYGTYHPDNASPPAMQGFVTEQIRAHRIKADLSRAAEVINYYPPDHVPVFSAMAENFVLFDRWFASVPGPTNPNRAYLTSGTSHGHGMNDLAFLTSALPQPSIFEQLSDAHIDWVNYSNTSWFLPDALFYRWTVRSGKSATHVKPLDQFYRDARAGTLPPFTWINPECCQYTSFHPPSPINMGEAFLKSIYEALRASPQWNETLFILTFDEHGGFADHVAPPQDVPPGDARTYRERAPDGSEIEFKFDRLGVRVPTVLMSPWVGRGVVQNRPTDQPNDFSHTSILKYVAELWDLPVLTPRVAWSPSFGGLITDTWRETPEKLPEPAVF